jgi:rhomboid protease GluP
MFPNPSAPPQPPPPTPPSATDQPREHRLRLPIARPRWTYVFLAINVVLFLALTVTGGSENSENLIRFQANYAPRVAEGEYWRLLTANFLHIGITHLLFNAYALYSLGAQVESLFGHRRFVTMYLLSGICGATFSFMFTQRLSAGASTSLFGMFGALAVYFYRFRKELGALGQQQLINLGLTLLVNVFLGIVNPRIDNWGHAGGLIGGVALAWFLCPHYEPVNPFAQAFASVIPANHKPELSNGELMDTNSLYQQRFIVTVFIVALIGLIALATTLQRPF